MVAGAPEAPKRPGRRFRRKCQDESLSSLSALSEVGMDDSVTQVLDQAGAAVDRSEGARERIRRGPPPTCLVFVE